MSVATMRAFGRSFATATATFPQPVQASMSVKISEDGASSSTASTISSVSWRGISTAGDTSSFNPQNSRWPTM